jgi:hypothetical protein
MENKKLKNNLIENGFKWAINQTYDSLAKEWIRDIF